MVLPTEITTAASLLEALDHRSTDPATAKAFDEAVWKCCGAEGAMLVTDLSGFTKITKQYGIIHFLAIFRRCQVACLPKIEKHGGTLLKQEADDFIVLFPDAPQAIAAAIDMLHATHAINETLAPEDRVHMCIGIEYGSLLRLHDDAYGDAVNVAFKLGEDIARPDEILVGSTAYERARRAQFDFSPVTVSEKLVESSGNVPLEHYSLRTKEC